jgi:hypothetical protein
MKPIETIHLFPTLSDHLISLLKDLDIGEWNKPSPIQGRTVKDLASHLLDGSLRRLSLQRDNYADPSGKAEIHSYSGLVAYIQQLNRDWMMATRRLSPQILIALLETSEKQLYEFLKTLNPMDKAFFSVAWAGEEESLNWFDIAREFTEKWHHQMQIRKALNRPLLMDRIYTEPLYDTFMLGLPHLYRDLADYPDGETIEFLLTGLNKSWFLMKQSGRWILVEKPNTKAKTVVQFSQDEAWLIFTNTDREKDKYRQKIKTEGDQKLGYKILDFVTVMS